MSIVYTPLQHQSLRNETVKKTIEKEKKTSNIVSEFHWGIKNNKSTGIFSPLSLYIYGLGITYKIMFSK